MKKIIALLTALTLLLTFIPCFAEAADSWTNILLLGGDSRDTEEYERTDTMMILSINNTDHQIKMTSVMRDTWVEFPGKGFSGKINAANVYGGPELALATVNQAFDMNIEKYVLINMADMVAIVDLAGGVDIEISSSELKWINEYNEDYLQHIAQYDGKTWLSESGLVHLNGLMATSYTRNRYSDSDFGRVERQQKVLLSLAKNMQDMEADEMAAVISDILSHIQTNLTEDELRAFAETGMICEIEDIQRNRIPADGTFESGLIDGVYKIKPDFAQNSALLKAFIYGEN